jgi:nucleoside-diphosphate-sugar epimerase
MHTILISGVTGFIGTALSTRLVSDGRVVRGVVRNPEKKAFLPSGVEPIVLRHSEDNTVLREALSGVDTVIHLAARVHVMREMSTDPLSDFRQINVLGTERLAIMASEQNVKRFVFLSSIGVNGAITDSRPFTEDDTPNPQTAYAQSKWEAERRLREIERRSPMEVVIIRSPLVYGPGNPGNFLELLNLVARGFVLPFGSVKNLRSFIYLENLVDSIVACATHPRAAGQTYVVCDGDDVSTPELIRRIAFALGRPARLIPFPPGLLRVAGRVVNKSAAMESLLGSLTVDCTKLRRETGWKPSYTMRDGLKATAEWFTKSGVTF